MTPGKLREYERKRDRGRTPEPFAGGEAEAGTRRFVVQRHQARSLHYDFRLERDGVLVSWAVPKGVPMEPGLRHLAVHVEDHPVEYARFEGEIPKGSYGAGTVEIWDNGTYELVEEKRDGGLTVRLHGERLDGIWALVPARLSGEEKNWLLMRKRDDSNPTTGERREHSPMLATLARDLPEGAGWRYEVKWDGYRALGYVRGGEAQLVSRNQNDLTQRFPGVARALFNAVRGTDCVVDGEVCALDEQGRPSFSALQQGKPASALIYAVFDVLEVDGELLTGRPLIERRSRLDELLVKAGRIVRLSESFDDGRALLAAVREQMLEGVIAKRDSSSYAEGKRSRDWLKVKTHDRQEFVICGWTRGSGRRAGRFGALVLGVHRDGELAYVGNCGTGFTDSAIDELLAKLRTLERPNSPFASVPKMPKVRKSDVSWVEPELVCEVEFVEWTHDGRLRAPSFQGLRADKPAEQVQPEVPIDAALPAELRRGRRVVKLSNLDKLFWPDEQITKGDLLTYYREVAPVLLPHLRNRPFTMRRYPDGAFGKAFFQKDAPKHMPAWIPRHRVQVTTRESRREQRWIEAPLVNEELALLWVVNMGCIDMNAWYSRIDRPARPDFVLFDLDPSPDVGWAETVEVARLVGDALDALGLASFAKTSGSDGMHVLVPIERRASFEDTRRFAEIVAGALERTNPGLVTTQWAKSKRQGVLIDVNQNGAGKTIASAYSVRPKAGAPVSTPLAWSEVSKELDPAAFTMTTVLERVRRDGDLFEGVLTTRQRLDRALAALE